MTYSITPREPGDSDMSDNRPQKPVAEQIEGYANGVADTLFKRGGTFSLTFVPGKRLWRAETHHGSGKIVYGLGQTLYAAVRAMQIAIAEDVRG